MEFVYKIWHFISGWLYCFAMFTCVFKNLFLWGKTCSPSANGIIDNLEIKGKFVLNYIVHGIYKRLKGELSHLSPVTYNRLYVTFSSNITEKINFPIWNTYVQRKIKYLLTRSERYAPMVAMALFMLLSSVEKILFFAQVS